MGRIVCKISCVAIFNLLFTSMFSDGLILKAYEVNPIVGRPFKLECSIGTTIIGSVDIKNPDDAIVGSCAPASTPFPATCSDATGYEASLNESAYTIQINTSSMTLDVNGTWVCLHDGQTANFTLDSPLTEIKDERLHQTPFTNNITTTPVSLTATYECINIPVHFKWFVEDESSQKKTELEFANTVIEKNSSLCMNHSGFDAYTETRSSSSVPNRNGRYRIGVEVHYSGEVTALQSIQYFDTYFSSPPTTTPPSTDATTSEKTNGGSKYSEMTYIYIATGVVVFIIILTIIVTIIVCVMRRKTKNRRSQTGNNSSNPVHVYTQKDHHVDYDGSYNSGKPERVSSMSSKPPVDDDRRHDRNSHF